MKCNKAQEWISLQLDGQLAAQHMLLLQAHLDACVECRRYCDDLLVGRRMLGATEPDLPEIFDWKLQLRLNQVLREAAREVKIPWQQPLAAWRRWFVRAGASAVVGLTAVLLLALVLPSHLAPNTAADVQMAAADHILRVPVQAASPALSFLDATRRPLDLPYRANFQPSGLGLQRQASSGGGLVGMAWSATADRDLARIRQLEQDLEALRRHLSARERQIQLLEAKLDSLARQTVDRARGD